jgi:hypothetical protein
MKALQTTSGTGKKEMKSGTTGALAWDPGKKTEACKVADKSPGPPGRPPGAQYLCSLTGI